uniref:CG-1 domain-containing protein n=1 Tax=Anopheles minimus TaxID=112268 RepID=A0A182WLJ4_9DIPT
MFFHGTKKRDHRGKKLPTTETRRPNDDGLITTTDDEHSRRPGKRGTRSSYRLYRAPGRRQTAAEQQNKTSPITGTGTGEEIAAILISFDKHSEWQSKEVKTR